MDNNINNTLLVLNSNWEVYSIPLLLLLLVVSGNFIGQLLPCKLQKSFTNNMYLKHVVAFLILLFVIEIGERKYQTFSELFFNTFIVYAIFLLAIRLTVKFFVAFLIVIVLIYSLYIYKEKQTDDTIKLKISQITQGLYYVALFILFIGVLFSYNKKSQKHGKDFSILTFLFGSECELREKHPQIKNNK